MSAMSEPSKEALEAIAVEAVQEIDRIGYRYSQLSRIKFDQLRQEAVYRALHQARAQLLAIETEQYFHGYAEGYARAIAKLREPSEKLINICEKAFVRPLTERAGIRAALRAAADALEAEKGER